MQELLNPYPVFIFEGPDNSGKDTLISLLKNYIWESVGNSTLEIHPKFEKTIERYKDYFLIESLDNIDLINNLTNRTLIFNRFFYSEYIYGQLYRNYTPQFQEKFEDYMLDSNRPVILIYTYAKPEILRTREDGLSFSKGDLTKIKTELELYNNVINNSKLKVIKIDTSECNIEKDFAYLIDSLSELDLIVK